MRTLASFAFSTCSSSEQEMQGLYEQSCVVIRQWLDQKGIIRESDGRLILHKGNRIATLTNSIKSAKLGTVQLWELLEPITGGQFETIARVGYSSNACAFSCRLRAGNPANVLSPIDLEIKTPRIVKNILRLSASWSVESTQLFIRPHRLYGQQGGSQLASLIQSPKRNLPLLVISSHQGLVLHPGVAELFADDLMGLCLVVEIDDLASWELTRILGKEYSCFNGAIRLYWPFINEQNPYRHPLWTSARLLEQGNDTAKAADILREQIKYKILGISAFTIRMPTLFEMIYAEFDREELEQHRKLAVDTNDYHELAKQYAFENDQLRAKLQEQKEINRQLREDLHNARLIQAWTTQDGAIQPNEEVPPQELIEAFERARREFADCLTFGDDVLKGIQQMAKDAGPPEKVFESLRLLAELTAEKRKDKALGKTTIGWLMDQGAAASGESDTIKKSRQEMLKRTWHDGKVNRPFDLHIKPNDTTSPDRCVRIYFAWDDTTESIVIGWIGRHP